LTTIFDPFFTTKPLGKGSGLGLYNARLFVEKHAAAISVDSKEGAGTTFHLFFSRAQFDEKDEVAFAERPTRHTLLVQGPKGEALDHLVHLLRQNGCYVVPATDESETMDHLYAPHFQFTGVLLLSANGRANELNLCRRIRDAQLPIKTMLSVFASNQDEVPDDLLRAVDALVPFDLPAPEFLDRIRKVLEGK
jgi:hypothetical protein